jgi:phthiocerol/phenolphthiocerol synthesis type-I polyketide synthase E
MMDERDDPGTGVAIIGMAGRFPGAPDLRSFWENLRGGVESVTFFSDEELAAAGVAPALLADPRYVKARGVLEGYDQFDPAFFGFTPREGELLDPQHRLFLESSWQALEDGGYDADRYPGRIAVYGGCGSGAYLVFNILPDQELLAKVGGLQAILLNEGDFFTTRVSYKLNLRGPSTLVQTACSTALVAVHTACQSLLSGEADMALAGGSQVDVPQIAGYLYQESSVMSRDGHCRSFDAEASGTVNGSGVGVVLLKRLADAIADGDRIHAVIRGSAINNDGSSKVGFTAPSVSGQAEVIAESLLMAGVEPGSVGYVETHGSATPLGDPVEVAALTQAFREGTEEIGFCAIGSVKSSIGHCNAAAGIAGLLKTVLTVENGEIPPSLHFESPNPQIDFATSPFFVNTQLRSWPADLSPRRAGVSSFGLGGTNAHVVLEQAPAAEPGEAPEREEQLLVLSARTPEALEAATERLAAHLDAHPEEELADVAFTLQVGRQGFEHRRAVVARSAGEAAAALRDPARRIDGRPAGPDAPPVVFLFPGLGDQYVDMARGLYDAEPVFRDELDRAAELLVPELGVDLRELLFSAGEAPARGEGGEAGKIDFKALLRRGEGAEDPAAARLARTEIAQPAHFVVEHALARLLLSWGIAPEAMIGYSIGEYTVACLAGVLELPDALRLVARRARLIAGLPEGGMLAVPLAEGEVAPFLGAIDPELSVAAVNGPYFTVVGGPSAAVAELSRRLADERGAACLPLKTTHAFHSAMMEGAVAPFTELVRPVPLGRPSIPYVSNVTGTWIAEADLADPGYWARHMRGTVRFSEGLAVLLEKPERAFLELGPGGTLSTLVRQHPLAPSSVLTASALRHATDPRSDGEQLLGMVARFWVAGGRLDWAAFHGGVRRLRLPLPTYPFERRRCWIDPPAAGKVSAETLEGFGVMEPRPDPAVRKPLDDWFYAPVFHEAPGVPPSSGGGEGWLVLLDPEGRTERLAERLRARGERVATVASAAGGAFAERGEGRYAVDGSREGYGALAAALAGHGGLPGRIVHAGAWGASGDSGDPARAIASLVLLAQALAATGKLAPIALTVLASGAAAVADGEPLDPAGEALVAAAKVVRQEFPEIAVKVVDVPYGALPAAGSPADLRLLDRLAAEAAGALSALSPLVALRGGRRYVRAFAPLALPAELEGAAALPVGGAYLVTVGPSGAGAALAGFLHRELGGRVAVVVAEGAEAAVAAPVAELTLAVAAGDPDGWGRAVSQAAGRLGRLDGVFHAALPTAGGLLQLKTGDGLADLAAPLAVARAVIAAADALPEPPAFVFLWSSTLTVAGGLGQLDTAVAGAFLDALAREGGEGGAPRVVAAAWDPYQWDAWLAAGAGGILPGATAEAAEDLAENRIAVAQSAAALRRLLGSGLLRTVVSARDLGRAIAETDAFTAQSFLAAMEQGRKEGKAQPRTLATPYEAPSTELEVTLAGIWQELFGLEQVGTDDDFLELGGHSLLAIQMATQIRNATGMDLDVSTLFEAPTVGRLAAALERLAAPQEDPDELARLLAEVESMSPEDALARMEQLAGAAGAPP